MGYFDFTSPPSIFQNKNFDIDPTVRKFHFDGKVETTNA